MVQIGSQFWLRPVVHAVIRDLVPLAKDALHRLLPSLDLLVTIVERLRFFCSNGSFVEI